MRRVIVHSLPLRRDMPGHGQSESDWDLVCWDLDPLIEECKSKEIDLLVMYKPWLRYSRLEDKLYDDWVGRMEGQSGCWVASEEEEAPLPVRQQLGGPEATTDLADS